MKLFKGMTAWYVNSKTYEVKEMIIKSKINGISSTPYLTECGEILDPFFCKSSKEESEKLADKYRAIHKALKDRGIEI